MNIRSSYLLVMLTFVSFMFLQTDPIQAQSSYAQGQQNSSRYVVRPGDTFSYISRTTGVPGRVILDLNPDLDPNYLRIGDIIILPATTQARRTRIMIEPTRGVAGAQINIRAAGFRPNSVVRVLAGRTSYSLRFHSEVRVNELGRVRTRARVPMWLRPGQTFFFAIESANRRTRAVSEPFRVTRRVEEDESERIDATGVLRDGAECPILRTDEGEVYSLVGNLQDFGSGDRVRIIGRTVEVSICSRGTTVEVRRIAEAE
jgi:LysM repeat protein